MGLSQSFRRAQASFAGVDRFVLDQIRHSIDPLDVFYEQTTLFAEKVAPLLESAWERYNDAVALQPGREGYLSNRARIEEAAARRAKM